MYILSKRADQLTADEIKRLVLNQVKENKSLDYKRDLSLSQDKDKKEFLFDVTSLCNTDGGCLIYGIEESKDEKGQNTGVPETIVGISIGNYDKLSQQIEDIIKGNTEPSISNIILNLLEVDGKSVLIIGISKSLGLPVMVTFNDTNKFYRRRNSGKYSVDVYELNQMFMQNQVLKDKAEKFRQERIEKVRSLKVFPTLDVSASYFLQIIPFSFLNEILLDFTSVPRQTATLMAPMNSNGWDFMHNYDGYATFTKSGDRSKIDGYNQIFRNGVYEVYTSRQFDQADRNGQVVYNLYGENFIQETLEKVSNGLRVLQQFRIDPPFLICNSIHGVLGGTISGSRPSYSRPFMIDEIFLPPIFLPEYEIDLYTQLKPVFDILWQAAAYSSSPSLR